MGENLTVVTATGQVMKALPNTMFIVKLEETGQEIEASLAGKMRKHYVRVLVGDKVRVELSVYDNFQRGRIVYREK